MGDVWGRELDLGESLRHNSIAGDIPDVVAHELKSQLRDLAGGDTVTDDLPEWVRGDDHDLVVGEVA